VAQDTTGAARRHTITLSTPWSFTAINPPAITYRTALACGLMDTLAGVLRMGNRQIYEVRYG
jgi:hypothetical protein